MTRDVRKKIIVYAAVAIGLATFVGALTRAWLHEIRQSVTCSVGATDPSLPDTAYMEVLLERQHPIEPYFAGKLFISIMNTDKNEPNAVEVSRSADGAYGSSTIRGDLV